MVEALALDGKAKIFSSNVMMVHFNSRCHRQWRREGGQGGLVPRGPGQLWGPGPSWIFVVVVDRKSVEDPGF